MRYVIDAAPALQIPAHGQIWNCAIELAGACSGGLPPASMCQLHAFKLTVGAAGDRVKTRPAKGTKAPLRGLQRGDCGSIGQKAVSHTAVLT
jgi:hypothetical protein